MSQSLVAAGSQAWVQTAYPALVRAWQGTWPREWTFAGIPYFFKSFAVLAGVHFLVGSIEFQRLGIAAMWFNLDSLVLLVASLLVLFGLFREPRLGVWAPVGFSAALVSRWALMFFLLEFFIGFLVMPGESGFHALRSFYRTQSPWIWTTYGVLPVSGILGCGAYLFLIGKLKAPADALGEQRRPR